MVTSKGNHAMGLSEFDHEIEYGTGIWPAIDVVAQSNDRVVWTQSDEFHERCQSIETAVNITNCEMPRHEVSPS